MSERESEKPPAPSDCYIVIGLHDYPADGVWGNAQIWVVAADSEEEAVVKISALEAANQFFVQLGRVLPRVGPLPEPEPLPGPHVSPSDVD